MEGREGSTAYSWVHWLRTSRSVIDDLPEEQIFHQRHCHARNVPDVPQPPSPQIVIDIRFWSAIADYSRALCAANCFSAASFFFAWRLLKGQKTIGGGGVLRGQLKRGRRLSSERLEGQYRLCARARAMARADLKTWMWLAQGPNPYTCAIEER